MTAALQGLRKDRKKVETSNSHKESVGRASDLTQKSNEVEAVKNKRLALSGLQGQIAEKYHIITPFLFSVFILFLVEALEFQKAKSNELHKCSLLPVLN